MFPSWNPSRTLRTAGELGPRGARRPDRDRNGLSWSVSLFRKGKTRANPVAQGIEGFTGSHPFIRQLGRLVCSPGWHGYHLYACRDQGAFVHPTVAPTLGEGRRHLVRRGSG